MVPNNCRMMILTPISAAVIPCKICGEAAPLFGTVDFNRNCEIEGGVKLPLSGTLVRYCLRLPVHRRLRRLEP